jgi:hypothetical protein
VGCCSVVPNVSLNDLKAGHADAPSRDAAATPAGAMVMTPAVSTDIASAAYERASKEIKTPTR